LSEKAINELRQCPQQRAYMAAISAQHGHEPPLDPWRDWAERWNVNTPCIVRWGWSVTQQWHRTGQRPTSTGIRCYNLGITREWPKGFQQLQEGLRRIPELLAPNPYMQSRSEYLERAGELWDRWAQALRDGGYQPIPPHPSLSVQCEWTVRRRACGEALKTLAGAHRGGVDLSAIRNGIRKVETVLSLQPLHRSSPTKR
jgi:hypothetical protein